LFFVQELGYAVSKHQILQLSDVWEGYCALVAQTNGDFSCHLSPAEQHLKNTYKTLSDEYQFYAHFIGRF
jgi:hypothetical protein